MLTQVGPNRFVDLTLPEHKHLKPWTAPVGSKAIARSKALKTPVLASRSTPAATTVQGKSIPPAPQIDGLHPLGLPRAECLREFHDLFDWMAAADKAPGSFSTKQQTERDAVGERVDLLRRYAYA